MANKITKREKYGMVKELISAITEREDGVQLLPTERAEMLMEFVDHELELLDRKNVGEKKPTDRQNENEAYKGEILDYMEMGSKYTITDLLNGVPNAPEAMTHNRIVALMAQLCDAGAVIRSKEKGITKFALSD